LFIVRNPFLYKPNNSIRIDDIGDPATAIQISDLSFFIRNQWVAEVVQFAELPVGFEAVTADAQDLGIELFKASNVSLKSLQFTRSSRGEIGEIKSKNDVLFTQDVS